MPGSFQALVQRLLEHLKALDRQVAEIEDQIIVWHRQNDDSRKLAQLPGIGPITASALVATVGDAKSLENGRQMAAWLGLVRQHSSSGRNVLLGISIPVPHYSFLHTVLRAGHDYLAPSSALLATS